MARLEDLQDGIRIRGLTAGSLAVKTVARQGPDAVEVIGRDADGRLHEFLVYRHQEDDLEIVPAERPFTFDAPGDLLRLASEALRIRLAQLFDPYLAVTTSRVVPLPHQISAVYEEMLPRQPLRFLLADDPGAGKTIMAGLLIKELKVRGDLERCLVIAPGSLTEQWQDELWEKFDLDFNLLTREMLSTAGRLGNPFADHDQLIVRLDQLSRNQDVQALLDDAPEWDLVVCDEAHKMSGHYQGEERKLTKRYKLGQRLGKHCRNFLLMTATPHNGKQEDFHLFMALVDPDRFAGRFRADAPAADTTDLMRRHVKEELVRFNGKKLFPERRSYTVQYPLSGAEAKLYAEVTAYVRDEMNRAEKRLAETGQTSKRIAIGFALMTLQRRLASSPEAIVRSLERRRQRLEERLESVRKAIDGPSSNVMVAIQETLPELNEEDWDEIYEESPQDEREDEEWKLLDHATAAVTIEELALEIARLRQLEQDARALRRAGTDAKWTELKEIFNHPVMTEGASRKLIIFTEFRDTLTYLAERIRALVGRREAVVEIHGSTSRNDRRRVVEAFMNDPEVLFLVANDAAGEGVNLQCAHLMVNYDLPWNPNRLEQRFGRIHRIGQREVCHLWNLIAKDTREGAVYSRLLEKLDVEREALGGKVFDILGQLFEEQPLRRLLMDAVRYGEQPEVRARLEKAVDNTIDKEHLQRILERRAFVQDVLDMEHVRAIRAEMERAHARRLQPHFIRSFFDDAFKRFGGRLHRRESGRWEISHVPREIRDRGGLLSRSPVVRRYERVCFEKEKVGAEPRAHLICPGSPLLDATLDLTLKKHGHVLRRGAVLVDDNDPGLQPRILFYLQHAVRDGRQRRSSEPMVISERLQFVEAWATPGDWDADDLEIRSAGIAPYQDYRPLAEEERHLVSELLREPWLEGPLGPTGIFRRPWEKMVTCFAVDRMVPEHVEEVRERRLPLIDKVEQEVRSRLVREIYHWDARAEIYKEQERAGKHTRLPARVAHERATLLRERLERRTEELQQERRITALPPRLLGGALIVPAGYLAHGGRCPQTDPDEESRRRIELLAMAKVVETEEGLGRVPRDVSDQRGIGHDIESADPSTGHLFFLEVKGVAGTEEVTLTRSEIYCARNEPEQFRLAIVRVIGDVAREPVYVRGFDFGEPVFGQTKAAFALKTLLQAGGPPS